MNVKFLWPGRTKNPDLKALQEFYLDRIRPMASCRIIETRQAKGLDERDAEKIKNIEALGLEKQLKDDYIICLLDEGCEMTSREFARFLEQRQRPLSGSLAFIVGGFLGLAERILKKSDFRLSLSKMTLSHELARIVLLEQVYRSLTILKGRHYAK